MLRSLYIQLLRLHPRGFRQRYGDEMLSIYDEAARAGRPWPLFSDACVSLGRQWALREDEWDQQTVPTTPRDSVPVFYCADRSLPRPSALLNGALAALAAFALVAFALGHGQGRRPWSTAFAGTGRAGIQSSTGVGAQGGGSTVAIGGQPGRGTASSNSQVGSDSVWVRVVRFYQSAFSSPRALPQRQAAPPSRPFDEPPPRGPADTAAQPPQSVLWLTVSPHVFDANHDGVVTANEMASASVVLAKLDSNHDGRLNLEDCYQQFSRSAPVAGSTVPGASVVSIRPPAKRDRPIQVAELQPPADRLATMYRASTEYGVMHLARAPNSGLTSIQRTADVVPRFIVRLHPLLAALDTDHDGEISPVEMRNASTVLKSLDKNGDGKITPDEWPPNPPAQP